MRCKTLTAAAAVLLMLTAGCSTLERVVYRPDINQGNYLTPTDVAKVRVGMTQQQVAYALGTPMMTDLLVRIPGFMSSVSSQDMRT
ncbi:small protein A [Salmonella enterica subsp. arizonae]|uniref:Outer membrane protein assembly factor BamE n=1 Tax=Salmonella enterica subsp. arizonae TaxID=59203 RepID=A0A379TM44_SALER|nr:small protein A [Salmonella enterica subsp. arizonae]